MCGESNICIIKAIQDGCSKPQRPPKRPNKTNRTRENHDPPSLCLVFGSHIASHHSIHQNDEMGIEKRPADLTDQVVDGFDLVLGASAVFVDHGGGEGEDAGPRGTNGGLG